MSFNCNYDISCSVKTAAADYNHTCRQQPSWWKNNYITVSQQNSAALYAGTELGMQRM